jgi:hypothetical protein
MSILKDFRFTVDVKGNAERVVETTTEEGLALSVATPPSFAVAFTECGPRNICSSPRYRRAMP